MKTKDEDKPFVAPEDIWIIFRRFWETFACFSFFCVARQVAAFLAQ